jgi:hypothetical protein
MLQFLSILLFGVNLFAQVAFQKIFGDTCYSEFGNCIIATSDGGYFIAGQANHNTIPYDERSFLIKTNILGSSQWIKMYGGRNLPQSAVCALQICASNYLMLGYYHGGSVFVMRTDAKGDSLWVKKFKTPYPNYAFTIRKIHDGNYMFAGSEMYVVGGLRKSNLDSLSRITIVKIDTVGEKLWEKIFKFKADLGKISMQTLAQEGYIIVGAQMIDPLFHRPFLFRLSASGDSLWYNTYDDSISWWDSHVIETADQEYMIFATKINRSYNRNFLIIKTSSQGQIIWRKIIGESILDLSARALIRDYDNTYLLAGAYAGKILLIRIDEHGNVLWQKSILEGYHCKDVVLTGDGGYAITGFRGIARDFDIILIKTDHDGNMSQIASNFYPHQINEYALYQNYPNPFNSSTEIRYCLPNGRAPYHVQLKVYDVLGRLVKVLVDQEQVAGTYAISWDGTELGRNRVASGVYFYSIEAGDLKSIRKMLMLQ